MWPVPPRRQTETVERMLAQAESLQSGLPADEFARAKAYIVGELTMSCEERRRDGPLAVWSELAHQRLIAPGAARASYEKLVPDDVARVATLWAPNRLQVAIAGPAPGGPPGCGRWSRGRDRSSRRVAAPSAAPDAGASPLTR